MLQQQEACDDGPGNSDAWSPTPHCNLACTGTAPTCGDGLVDPAAELCDDGNTLDDATCPAACEHVCSPQALAGSNVGCDFWPTVTGTVVDPGYSFAVSVVNPGPTPVTVTIGGGALPAQDLFVVPGGGLVVRPLPWVDALKLCSSPTPDSCLGGGVPSSALAVGGAYHLRSTGPVAVAQFSPLDVSVNGGAGFSYSNEASLLLPSTSWGLRHFVASWGRTLSFPSPSLLTITAREDNTSVWVTSRAAVTAEGGARAFLPGQAGLVILNAGDALELGSLSGDLTGSEVVSDKPVQLLGGHFCALVPEGFGYCDHLEESIPPVSALSNRSFVHDPVDSLFPGGKQSIVRIVATEANTSLTYDPPSPGAPGAIANAGDFVELRTAGSFLLTSDKKVLVTQLMLGSGFANSTGDPALTLAVPVDQYLTSYAIYAPPQYAETYLEITAPAGATVSVDGVAVGGFVAIGATGYELARVFALDAGPAADGRHLVEGSAPFGLGVYATTPETSYWLPGGLALAQLPAP